MLTCFNVKWRFNFFYLVLSVVQFERQIVEYLYSFNNVLGRGKSVTLFQSLHERLINKQEKGWKAVGFTVILVSEKNKLIYSTTGTLSILLALSILYN